MLSAGERRAYTANDIFRDPGWRKRDADGALRVSVEDAQALGLVAGGRARITTAAGSAEASVEISEAMLPGHAVAAQRVGSWISSMTTARRIFPEWPRTLSPQPSGETPTRARRGTSTCPRGSKPCPNHQLSVDSDESFAGRRPHAYQVSKLRWPTAGSRRRAVHASI